MARGKSIDSFVGKVEELVDTSQGKVRADVVHERLELMRCSRNEGTPGAPSRSQGRKSEPGSGVSTSLCK